MASRTSIKFEEEDETEYKCDLTVKEELLSQNQENYEVTVKAEPVEIECSFDPVLYVDHQVKEEMVIGPTEFLQQNIVTSNASVSQKTSYQCALCSKTFKFKIALNKHKRMEHNNNTTVVSYFFHKSKKLVNKKSSKNKCIENGKSEYDSITCGVCYKHFATVTSLRNHMKRCPMLKQKSDENVRSDRDCKKEEIYNSNIGKEENCAKKNAEEKLVKNSDIKCQVCSKTFTLKANLRRHMNVHSENKMYPCDKCDMSFHRKDYLVKHNSLKHSQSKSITESPIKKHNSLKHSQSKSITESPIKKLQECKCGKKFYDKWRLQKHLDFYCKLNPSNDEKKFFCDLCNKGFSHKYVLKEHLMRHSNEKTLICDFCGDVFPQKYLLIRHILHHMTVPKVMYECEICDKKFIRSWSLKKHLISHTGKKPFACKYCGRNFRSRWGCLNHEKQFCEERDD
ncbi:zinc-finger double domain-containing protein [Phthorimaea operculella]|nr:zinc-finger double domain-containing protein [Phthorimaea operculella]